VSSLRADETSFSFCKRSDTVEIIYFSVVVFLRSLADYFKSLKRYVKYIKC